MEYSSVLLDLLKDENLKRELNPLVFYCLKTVYGGNFKKRSRYFAKALKRFFGTLGNTLEVSLFNESAIQIEGVDDNTILNESIMLNLNPSTEKNDNLNISLNKDCFLNMTNLFSQSWEWSINILYQSDEEYLLDKEDDYILVKLIKHFLFSDEDPKYSQLLISYNVFATSVELIYCLKLAELMPRVVFNPREGTKIEEYTQNIKYRIKIFYGHWTRMYKEKYEKSPLIKFMIGNSLIAPNDDYQALDLISLSMVEPLLNSKYVSFTKLIREGPFCFEIEEVARQICIIDHEQLASLKLQDYNKYIYKKEVPQSFSKFEVREKQIKCYILLFILMHNNLENKKNMIQNFISLAHTCKVLQNEQSSYTIISALNIVGLSRKKLLWKLIEKKYREIYSNLEKDFNDAEMNDNYTLDPKNAVFPFVPHINRVKNSVNNFIIRQRTADLETQVKIAKDYKDYYLLLEEFSRNKYAFFKVNPLYDFFRFGFLEIFKPRKWNLKSRIDFSHFTDDINQLDQLLDFLITNFKKLDN